MLTIKADNTGNFRVHGSWIPGGTKEASGVLGTDNKSLNRTCAVEYMNE